MKLWPFKPWVRKTLWGISITVVLLIGVIGFAHTPWGRPILPYFHWALGIVPKGAGCPLGFDVAVDPTKAEADRQAAFQKTLAGKGVARSTKALGFELGTTDRTAVQAWLDKTGSTCVEKLGGAALGCSEVPAEAVGGLAVDDAFFRFDQQARLVGVDIFRTATAAAALQQMLRIRGELDAAVGKATTTRGPFEAAFIEGGAMRRVSAEYRYQQFSADLSIMNYGKGRIRLREQYQWAPPVQTAVK